MPTLDITTTKDTAKSLTLDIDLSSTITQEIDDQKIIEIAIITKANEVILDKIESNLFGCLVELVWESNLKKRIHMIQDGPQVYDFSGDGGKDKTGVPGATGDILLRTFGVGAGDGGPITLTFRKKE